MSIVETTWCIEIVIDAIDNTPLRLLSDVTPLPPEGAWFFHFPEVAW
jgi:hypothetical protein